MRKLKDVAECGDSAAQEGAAACGRHDLAGKKMGNLIHEPGFWSIIGVIIGLIAGEGIRWYKDERQIKKGIIIISDELVAIKSQIPFKVDILNKSIEEIDNKQVLATASSHTPDIGYRMYITSLYKRLSLKQRNCLHVIYERLSFNDEFMDKYEEQIKKDIIESPARLDCINKMYKSKLMNIRKGYEVINDLIDSYLKDNPADVFYTED